MGTITLKNVRATSDLTVKVRLKDGGTAISWPSLSNIKAWLYSDAQKAISGRFEVSVDEGDATILVCHYSAQKPQYLGLNRVIVQATYLEDLKTYDKPAFIFVRWTDDQTQDITIDDPDVDVEIEVQDVSSSILDAAIAAAVTAAVRAEEAAAAAEHMVDIHQGPPGEDGKSPYIGENGHWYEWDEDAGEYVDTETEAQGETGTTPDITIGTVTTAEPGTPAAATMTGTPEAPVLNLTIPKGVAGDTPAFTVGEVTTGQPGTPVVVTITGTAAAPVLNVTIPQGLQGNTGSSVDYPYELVNNLTTNDATKGLSAAQGKVLKDELTQLEAKFYKLGDNVAVNATSANWKLKGDGLSASDNTAQMRKFKVVAGETIYLKLSADTPGVYQFQNNASVPGSGTNNYLVGSPVTTATDTVVTVPSGATYLIISELKTNSTNVVRYATSQDARITAAQTELDNEFGYSDTHTLVAGRDNTGPKINMKSGVQYRLTAQLSATPSSGYVSVDIYDSGGTALYHIYNITDADVHTLDITPSANYENAYISFYASGNGVEGSPCRVTLRRLDSIAQEVSDISDSLGFSETKKLSAGRSDVTTKFDLISGKRYILTAQLAEVPDYYVTITLKDADNNTLLDLGQRKDTLLVSGIFDATQDYKNAYIYVYQSTNNSAKGISIGFAEVGSTGGNALESMGESLITDKNPANEFLNRIRQARRQPRVGATTQGITPLVLLHFSDIHGSERELKRIVEYRKAYNKYIDDIINTGDSAAVEASDGMDFFDSVPGAEKILNTIGNHDSRANGEWTGFGAVASYNQYIKPYVANWGVTQPENAEANGYNYYYKDYSDANVRLVVLDCMFWDSTEKTWFESVLADARTEGLAVLVCCHYPGGSVTRFDIPWTTLQYSDVSQTTNAEAAGAIHNFIEDGGEFVCWLNGHTHYDFVGRLADYPEQVDITIDCANELSGKTAYSDIERVIGARSQDLFNIVAVDTFRKLVKVFRVGADRDSWMRHRGDLCIKYDTQEVLYFD